VISAPIKRIHDLNSCIDSIYSLKNRSYKELPLRYHTNQRHELTEAVKFADKELFSLGTIAYKAFCEPEDMANEVRTAMNALTMIFRNLGLNYSAQVHAPNLEWPYLSLITDILQRAIVSQTQIINPKLTHTEVHFNFMDSLDREWTLVSCRIGQSEQQFISRQGEFTPAVEVSFKFMLEEILAYLIEDKEGILPLWLAPVQTVLIPITDAQHIYAEDVSKLLTGAGFRTNVDTRSETMQAKIRDAELAKIPTIIVIGEKEQRSQSVSLRLRNNQEIGLVSLDRLTETLQTI
jgi:threonyl-tRNA synthetase